MIWCDNLTNCKETSGAEGRALFVRTNANRENPAQLRLSSLEFPDLLDVQERALHATILSRANATGFLRGCRTDVVDRHPSFPNPSLLSPLKSLNRPPIDRSPQLLFCCFLPLLLYLVTPPPKPSVCPTNSRSRSTPTEDPFSSSTPDTFRHLAMNSM